MKLVLPRDLRARIENEARLAFPKECCGLIEGVREARAARACTLHAGRNIASRSDWFEIDPRDHFAALKTARANGRVLIGCYHSHPGGRAVPSESDLKGAGEEEFLWVIAALSSASAPVRLGAFVYCGADFLPAGLEEGEETKL